jgi:hypothetical protein
MVLSPWGLLAPHSADRLCRAVRGGWAPTATIGIYIGLLAVMTVAGAELLWRARVRTRARSRG